jgi:hypothetical protein
MQVRANLARPAAPPKVEQVEALSRAVNGLSPGNYPAIFGGFVAKGIPEAEIKGNLHGQRREHRIGCAGQGCRFGSVGRQPGGED